MRVLDYSKVKRGTFSKTAITIGAFDGVHLGHRRIFRVLLAKAKEKKLRALAITFCPLPREVLGNNKGAIAIVSFEERLRRIREQGISRLIVIRFNPEFAKQRAGEFMDTVKEKFAPRLIVIGHDFRFGKEKEAGEQWLKKYCAENNIELKIVPAFKVSGEPVSSTRIRKLLSSGEMELANRLLGKPYQIEGVVEAGKKRGKSLGFPTANIYLDKEPLVPKGVYIGKVIIGAKTHKAVINIGVNPTFNEKRLVLEAHILDFSRKLYGKRMKVLLLKRIRAEKKFSSVSKLVDQMKLDLITARKYFKK